MTASRFAYWYRLEFGNVQKRQKLIYIFLTQTLWSTVLPAWFMRANRSDQIMRVSRVKACTAQLFPAIPGLYARPEASGGNICPERSQGLCTPTPDLPTSDLEENIRFD